MTMLLNASTPTDGAAPVPSDAPPGEGPRRLFDVLHAAELDRRWPFASAGGTATCGDQAGPDGLRPIVRARNLPVAEAILQHRVRNRCSLEETVLSVFHAALSLREAEEIVATLWGARVDLGLVERLREEYARKIDAWCGRPLGREFPYVFLAAVTLKRHWGHDRGQARILVASGANRDGYCDVLGVAEATGDEREAWQIFLDELKKRGLSGVELAEGTGEGEQAAAVARILPGARFQRCAVEFRRQLLREVPATRVHAVEQLLGRVFAAGDAVTARACAAAAVIGLEKLRLPALAAEVRAKLGETLTYLDFPVCDRPRLLTEHRLKRILRELREHTRIVGAFSDGGSAVRLVAARLRFHVEMSWRNKRYFEPGIGTRR